MTLTRDTYDVWTEAAFTYLRDQLRTSTTVGYGGSEGVKAIEVGIPDLETAARSPEALPEVWLSVPRDSLGRSSGYVTHRIRVDVHVLSATVRSPRAGYVDGQARHRVLTGRVYNELLDQRDAGIALGHWQKLDPDGELLHEGASTPDRAVLHSLIPIAITRDRAWIQGA